MSSWWKKHNVSGDVVERATTRFHQETLTLGQSAAELVLLPVPDDFMVAQKTERAKSVPP